MNFELKGAGLLLLSLLSVSSCICSTSGVNRGDINLVPLAEEWEMGAQLAQEVSSELTLVQDPEVQAYIDRLGEQLAAETELAEQPWTFHVVADPTLNAFIIPGGHVYVHTGLILAAENVAELAGVMAHEIGHGVSRHSTERLTKLYGINFVASLLLGESPGLIEQIAAQFIGSGVVAKFSRDDEREADRLGLSTLYEAGFEPEGMAALFEKLLQQRQRRPNMVERFFSSHPVTEERIEAVRREAEALAPRADLLREDPAFRQVQQRLAGYAGQGP